MQKELKKLDGEDYLVVSNNIIIPVAYFAPIEYYAIFLKYNCKIDCKEYFKKQSIRNRCEIYSSNGILRLTIPKKRKESSKTVISKLKISYEEDWQKKHWKSLETCYNSSPFFDFYKDDLYKVLHTKENYLFKYNLAIHNIILKFLRNDNIKSKMKSNIYDLREYNFKKHKAVEYPQVFMEKYGFIANLSIIDLIFNLGPESIQYLEQINI